MRGVMSERKRGEREEEELIAFLEREEGRSLTEQEKNLAIEQARAVGHLQ
jgi:hypothetical protein